MSTIELTEIENDCLKEMANVGGGHASGALSQLFQRKVNLGVPQVQLVTLNSVKHEEKDQAVAVYSDVESEDLIGNLIVAFPWQSSLVIKRILKGTSDAISDITMDDENLFIEIGHIVFQSYSDALNNFLSMEIKFGKASFLLSDSEVIMDEIFKDHDDSKYALIISTEFDVDGSDINGEFDISFIPNEIEHLLQKIKEKFGL